MIDHRTGVGVLINMLGGHEATARAVGNAEGKTITSIALTDDTSDGALRFDFTDGSALLIYDDGRSCCESRWMHTDDNLSDFVGAVFLGAEVRDGPEEEGGEYDEYKESQFLVISTSIGQFTVINYNEHNGYYGGFWMVARELPAEATP